MIVDPGEMDQRITFRTDTKASDGMGGNTLTPVDVVTVWAKAISKSGKEQTDYDRVNALGNYDFITHYRSDISESMRIFWNGQEYNIRFIEKLGSRKLYSLFKAERGVPQ
tara:strand:- start:2550 stop:2879 length:330 start_codon:yes stop_codon:yes gene_type:complete